MAPLWSLIKDLDSTKTSWALKVRVVRSYDARFQNQNGVPNFECVLHDQEGLRIHATIPRRHVDTFKPLLKEGQLIAIKNFVVCPNKMSFKTTNNKYSIHFIKKTHAFEFFDHSFPTLMFEFQRFSDFSVPSSLDETRLFDFIGKLKNPGTTKYVPCGSRDTKIRNITIEDIEKNQLSCTLWEDYADVFSNLLEKKGSGPHILILQLFRGKLYGGNVHLCSAYNVSKMLLNEDIPEINDFRNQLVDIDDQNDYNEKDMSNPSPSSINPSNEGSSNVKQLIRTIEQLIEDKEVGYFWVYGEIIDVESTGSWSYVPCKRCLRKISPHGDGFYCDRCNQTVPAGNLRYKIRVRVVDDSGTTLFLLWDRECVQLIGKTATDLTNAIDKGGETTADAFPREIETLIEQKLYFKVHVKGEQLSNYNGAYSVVKVSTADNFITMEHGD